MRGNWWKLARRSELLTNPKHPYTELLLAAVPRTSQRKHVQRQITPGEPPDLANLPKGCVFQPRCRYAKEICGIETPPLRLVGCIGTFVSCHLAESINLQGIRGWISPLESMRMNSNSIRRFSTYALAYLLWAITIVLGGMVLLQARDAYLSVVVLTTFDRYKDNATDLFYSSLQTRTLDQWSYLLLGLLLVVLIVFIEHFYRTGVQPGILRLRFFQVTAIEFAGLFLANLTSAMVIWGVSGFTWRSLFYPLLELLTTIIFIWLWIDTRRRKMRSRTARSTDQPVGASTRFGLPKGSASPHHFPTRSFCMASAEKEAFSQYFIDRD